MFSQSHKDALARLQQIRSELKSQFIQRDAEVDGLCLALLTGTNMLLLGPPGTAKSNLTEVFAGSLAVPRDEYYKIQCNAYTVPEQIFGPTMISKLQNDEYERKTDGYLPKARVAYLDEIFNMNQTQLTTLNEILEEKEFGQGPRRDACPLELCVGAANVYPEGDRALAALYDRFLIRFWTPYISTRTDFIRLLKMDKKPACQSSLQDGDIAELRSARATVQIPDSIYEAVADVKEALLRKGVVGSDRRWQKCMKVVQSAAALDGRDTVKLIDVMVLADSMWGKHEERPVIYSALAERCAPAVGDAQRILDGVVAEYTAVDVNGKDERGSTGHKENRRRLIGIANVAIREIGNLQGADDSEAILEMAEKVEGMRKVVARAAAKLDHRVGHLLGK